MKRGEIYITAGRGDFSGKPQPSLIIQSDLFNEHHPSVAVCPITSELTGDFLQRVSIEAGEHTGLDADSEIQIDKTQVIKVDRLRRLIGSAPDGVMARVEDALRLWFDL